MISPQGQIDVDAFPSETLLMKIPMKKKFALKYGPITLRYDEEIDQHAKALEAAGVDFPEVVRILLRENLPEVREKLKKSAS